MTRLLHVADVDGEWLSSHSNASAFTLNPIEAQTCPFTLHIARCRVAGTHFELLIALLAVENPVTGGC